MFGLFLNFRLGPPPQGPNGHPQLLQQQQQQQQQLMSNSNSSNNKFMLHNNQLLLDTKSETKQNKLVVQTNVVIKIMRLGKQHGDQERVQSNQDVEC